MHFSTTLIVFIAVGLVSADGGGAIIQARAATLGGRCTGAGGLQGTCISTSSCTADGGTHILNACPGLPDNIRCCTKKSCGTGGVCQWANTCDGTTKSGLCPGPTDFKCCESDKPPKSGNCSPETVPGGGCAAKAISGGNRIASQFPCEILEIGCKRNCDSSSTSDHCTGKANDLMVAAYGHRTTAGEPIAEWIMKHAASLDVHYVMWGQKIWSTDRDAVKPWSEWRSQSPHDRGGNTANHWDHVHVSYK